MLVDQPEQSPPAWTGVDVRPYPDLGTAGLLLQGAPSRRLVQQFTSGRRSRLFINGELGSRVRDLSFLREITEHLVALDVVSTLEDDSDVLHCSRLRSLELNTSCSGVLDWTLLPDLQKLFAYGNRVERRGFTGLALQDLYLYAPRMADLRRLANLPLRHLALSPARSLRTLHGIRDLRLTSLMLTYLRQDVLVTEPLRSQPSLRHIVLQNVRVPDLEWVTETPLLESIILRNTGPLATLKPLSGHPSLRRLVLTGSSRPPTTQSDIFRSLPALQEAHVPGMPVARREG